MSKRLISSQDYKVAQQLVRAYEEDQRNAERARDAKRGAKYVGKFLRYDSRSDSYDHTTVWYALVGIAGSGEIQTIEYIYTVYHPDNDPYVAAMSIGQGEILVKSIQDKFTYKRISKKRFLQETEFIRSKLAVRAY